MKRMTVKDKYNNEYVLEFTRATVIKVEEKLNVNEAENAPMTTAMILFEGAFLANHKNVKKETIDEIFYSIPDITKLSEALVAMYAEAFESLEGETGNATWETNW